MAARIILIAGVFVSAAVYLVHVTLLQADDLATTVRISICGDAIISPGELCDAGYGNNLGLYGSSTAERTCGVDCVSFGPYCGDDILQVRFSEGCDDGNNTSGDLCSATCTPEVAVPPSGSGSPRGSIPTIPGATPGVIQSQNETKVVLRGKAYPNVAVNVLLDGKVIGTTQADSNADFLFSTTEITPGTATFGFSAKDKNGIASITTSVVFEVLQSAVTTVSNIFFPPTIKVSNRTVAPGGLLTLSGQSIPLADVVTEIDGGGENTFNSETDRSGNWALQVDTNSIAQGRHSAKAFFEQNATVRSGYGKSVTFTIGAGAPGDSSPDLNKDGKVNLVDFSIFLLSWDTDNAESDFNEDGSVNLADFSIMLFNWTG